MPDITELTEKTAMDIYTQPKGLDPYIAQIRAEIDAFVPDTSTNKTRREIASMAMKIAKSKTYLDSVGKKLVTKLKQQPKLVDAERKRVRDVLDAWRDEVRAPLTEWENKENARVETIRTRIDAMSTLPHESEGSEAMQLHISRLQQTQIDDSFDEFIEEAAITKDKMLRECGERLAKLLVREAEQEELDRLRRAQIEQNRIERERKIAEDAAAAAKLEAEQAAAEKIRKANEQKERAKRQAEREKEKARQLKLDQERKVQEAVAREKEAAAMEASKIEAETLRRAKDLAHRQTVVNEATESLVYEFDLLSPEAAEAIIRAIADGKVRHVSIKF